MGKVKFAAFHRLDLGDETAYYERRYTAWKEAVA